VASDRVDLSARDGAADGAGEVSLGGLAAISPVTVLISAEGGVTPWVGGVAIAVRGRGELGVGRKTDSSSNSTLECGAILTDIPSALGVRSERGVTDLAATLVLEVVGVGVHLTTVVG
jgi:hypothetical protein